MESLYNSIRNIWPLKKIGLFSDTSDVKQEFVVQPGHQITAVLQPWESYVITTQSLMIWEKPTRSVIALLLINIIFWLTVWIEPKPYFLLGSAALGVFLHQQWVYSIWPEIRVPLQPGKRPPHYSDEWLLLNPSVLSVPEIGALVDQWLSAVRGWRDACLNMRTHRPALFCLCSCSVFNVLLLAGQLVSGTAILYAAIMTSILAPGAHRFVAPAVREKCCAVIATLKQKYWHKLSFGSSNRDGSADSSPDELSEFLPETGTEEADAALTVPLLSADPPEVVQVRTAAHKQHKDAAVSSYVTADAAQRHGGYYADHFEEQQHGPRQLRATPAMLQLQSSPYGSLSPHIPTHSELPSVSDSSDDDEQEEFMHGLVFDSIRKTPRGNMPASGPISRYSDASFGGQESLRYDDDEMDASQTTREIGGVPGNSQLYAAANLTNAPSGGASGAAAMQTIASTLLQYPQAGGEMAGALLSTLGQSVFSSVVGNVKEALNNAAAEDAAATEERARRRAAGGLDTTDGACHDATDAASAVSKRTKSEGTSGVRRSARKNNPAVSYLEEDSEEEHDDFEMISDDESSE
uniref:Reticulophagy receptor Fam134b-like n=1 Tax=Hirondellea gigas TaxID=1518452 RepID=A0A6A7FSF0_9CRUS